MSARRRPPRIAVLLATYNGAAFLGAQLESLAAQEDVSVEVFARDDGSTDETLAILARFASLWPALGAPMCGPNLGPAASFMELLRAAPGNFDAYAFCDQDDVWKPEKLARAMARLAEAETPALYCSRVELVDGDLRPLGLSASTGDGRFQRLLFENIAFGNTVVMNAAARAAIVSAPPPTGMIMHDWWCALVVSGLGTVIHDDEPGVLYRQHGSNQIGATLSRWREGLIHLRNFIRSPSRFYPIRAQAAELLRLHGEALRPEDRALAQALVDTRASILARLRFAASGRLIRSSRLWTIAGRLLLAAGWS